jgi:hypothetical protein
VHPREYTQQSHASSCAELDTAKAILAKLASVKSRQDLGAALDIDHRDAVLLCPPWQSQAHGHAQVEESLLSLFRLAPDCAVDLASRPSGTLPGDKSVSEVYP